MRLAVLLDRFVAGLLSVAAWLVLPIVVLLLLQWPLRDAVRAYSREANDLGQCLFAFYAACAVTAAMRAKAHLSVDSISRRYSPRLRGLLMRLGIVGGLLPWAAFIVYAGHQPVVASTIGLEGFPDSFNPGYFLVKIAMELLAVLVLLQGGIDLFRPHGTPRTQ